MEIKLDEPFEPFPKAPNVEAVIDIRTRAMAEFEESSVRTYLETKLNGYAFLISQREFKHQLQVKIGNPSSRKFDDLGLEGMRFRSADEKHIAQLWANLERPPSLRLEIEKHWHMPAWRTQNLSSLHPKICGVD